MRKPKKIHWDDIGSSLQHVFVRRINAELEARKLSDNELAERCHQRGWKVGQSSVSRITGGRQDPTLEMIHKLADSIGLRAIDLLTDTNESPKRSALKQTNVRNLPPFPSMLGTRDKPVRKLKGDRKRR